MTAILPDFNAHLPLVEIVHKVLIFQHNYEYRVAEAVAKNSRLRYYRAWQSGHRFRPGAFPAGFHTIISLRKRAYRFRHLTILNPNLWTLLRAPWSGLPPR